MSAVDDAQVQYERIVAASATLATAIADVAGDVTALLELVGDASKVEELTVGLTNVADVLTQQAAVLTQVANAYPPTTPSVEG